MLTFVFPPHIQAGLALGIYKLVYSSKTGLPLSMVQWATGDKAGQIAAHAISTMVENTPLAPFVTPFQFLIGAAQMIQTHVEFREVNKRVEGVSQQVAELDTKFEQFSKLTTATLNSLESSVGVLQATTAITSVGVAVGVALAAINLHQTLKLREDVKKLKLEIKDGFIELKQAYKDQGFELIQHIDKVAQDVEFKHHRTILGQAYGYFLEATKLIKFAISIQDISVRNSTLETAKGMLAKALADYNNPRLFSETCAAGQLRRMECAWAIEQTIAFTFQLQNAPEATSQCLANLQNKIRQDTLKVINHCQSNEELDFLFPEIKRIHDHDLAVLESWQNHVDWVRSLSPSELKLLANAEFNPSEFTNSIDNTANTNALAIPPEQLEYENLKQKSHPASLRAQLVMMMQPELRREYGNYISNQAVIAGYKTLVPTNLEKASNLTVANLYWYFKVRDESVVVSA